MSSAHTDTTRPWSQEPAEWLPIQASTSLETGDLVAERYRIEGSLGKGGMGAVYRVQDLELDEEVALKVLALDVAQGTMLERFKQEIRLAR
ncbi:MAG: protein kinase, partial [Thermoanaerobaculia bacterium]